MRKILFCRCCTIGTLCGHKSSRLRSQHLKGGGGETYASFLDPHFILGKRELFIFIRPGTQILKLTLCSIAESVHERDDDNVGTVPLHIQADHSNQSLSGSRTHFRAVITRTTDYVFGSWKLARLLWNNYVPLVEIPRIQGLKGFYN